MPKSSGRRRMGRQSARTGSMEVFFRPQESLVGRVVGLLIRLRVELLVVACATVVYLWLRSHLPALVVHIGLLVIVVTIAVVPASRRYVTRRCWCVITRHRVHACFEQTRTMTYSGKTPALLWSRPTPVGERVRVWLPAGLSVKNIEVVSAQLAAACFARSARIEPDPKRATACVIHIIRRDPLGTTAPLSPDLLDHVNIVADTAPVRPLPTRDEVLADLATTADTRSGEHPQALKRGARAGHPGKSTNPNEPNPPAVEGFGGMDVSDYV